MPTTQAHEQHAGMDPGEGAARAPAPGPRRPRVLHFVTGGFSSGSVQVAIQLVNAGLAGGRVEPLLVLRRKRRTDPARVAELQEAGTPVRVVPGWTHAATIAALVRLCREFRPDVFVAHGFSEHLWGRYAGLLAGVPHLVHVEHNSRERYTPWRRAQTRWLAARTSRIVGCSEGVRQVLLAMGMPPGRTIAIPNGIRIEPFAAATPPPPSRRVPGVVMVSRLSRQKDHATLLRAVALLGQRGLRPPVLLAGQGKPRYLRPLQKLSRELGLDGQVRFLGLCRNVPELLIEHRVCVLATHYEGMPLALIEGMAAGCVAIGSAVVGVRELLEDGGNGLLVPESDPGALADALAVALQDDALADRLGAAAREEAMARYTRERMNARYEAMFLELAAAPPFRA